MGDVILLLEFRMVLQELQSRLHTGLSGGTLEVSVVEALERAGLETRVVKRNQEYTDELVRWADVIVTTGGDGTFLMGASKIFDRNKPVIGINTDPTRSEGHLCLPKHYSFYIQVDMIPTDELSHNDYSGGC